MFKTKDLPLAAVLKTKGIKMIGTEKGKRDTMFIFKGEEECDKIKFKHYNGEVELNSLDLLNNYNTLKGLALSNNG